MPRGKRSPRRSPTRRRVFDDGPPHALDERALHSLLQAVREAPPVMFDGRVFRLDLLPVEWKMLFKSAGIKKRDLTNPATAPTVAATLRANLTPAQLAKLPRLTGL